MGQPSLYMREVFEEVCIFMFSKIIEVFASKFLGNIEKCFRSIESYTIQYATKEY